MLRRLRIMSSRPRMGACIMIGSLTGLSII
nr:MAG TPA: hypothetical protein [Caudoviricetes sp.]